MFSGETIPHTSSLSERVRVVLYQPHDVVNIGGVARAMLNMGFGALHLVAPAPFEPAAVERIAHRSAGLLAAARQHASLDDALADTVYVVGTTERLHGQHPITTDVRTEAATIVQRAAQGPVALLFGPENNGLDLPALDRCHTLLRLPTASEYPSLNLAQAVLLLLYEVRMAAPAALPAAPPPAPPPASSAELARLFAAWEEALHAIDFFKQRRAASLLRPLRAALLRARLNEQQAALLLAIAREVVHALRRAGPREERRL
jgi:TrmH family RNA methyltransferase